MTTPTPIETFEDILAAMENNPRLQAAMRQHVLDQEFLQLPAIVRELQQAIAQLTQLVHDYIAATDARLEQIEARLDRLEAGQARLESDVTELKTGQARLESDVTELKTGQARLESDVAELKTGQARLESDVAELKTGQARLESDVTELKTGQARLESDVTELKTGQAQMAASQARMEGNMNRLIGSDYERKAARRASRLAKRYLGMEDMRVIYAITMPDSNQFPAILNNAVRAGRMDASEADELEEVDIVMRGPSEYAVAEVSITVDESDVQRARERAGLLSKAVTEPVRAIVVGVHTLDSASQLAATNHVAVMILPE